MEKIKYWLLVFVLAGAVVSCSDDDNFRESILDVTPDHLTELDEWIRDNFGVYNIDVIYKWKGSEVNQELTLVPVNEDKVIPFLSVVRRIWMNPYIELGGDLFFKKTTPKQIMLIGSAGYMEDGTYLLGEAEQGNRITIYNLNMQDNQEKSVLARYTHTFHHEYVHILHQIVKYPSAYEELCSGDYTHSWSGHNINSALALGFISPYAMADANEDFAEMISQFVVVNDATWQKYFTAAESMSPVAYGKLREKETMALQYMQNVWGIDLYRLRELVLRELELIDAENKQEQP